MPKVREIRKGREIGSTHTCKYMWCACVDCRKERWVRFINGKLESKRCQRCNMVRLNKLLSGKKNPRWKGGRQIIVGGYYEVYISSKDPLFPMAVHALTKSGGFAREHRLVMARHLNRCLGKSEVVHHLNGIRTDNRLENLTIVDSSTHKHNTIVGGLQERIRILEDELKLNKEEK